MSLSNHVIRWLTCYPAEKFQRIEFVPFYSFFLTDTMKRLSGLHQDDAGVVYALECCEVLKAVGGLQVPAVIVVTSLRATRVAPD